MVWNDLIIDNLEVLLARPETPQRRNACPSVSTRSQLVVRKRRLKRFTGINDEAGKDSGRQKLIPPSNEAGQLRELVGYVQCDDQDLGHTMMIFSGIISFYGESEKTTTNT